MSDRVDGSEILNPGLLRHQITWQVKSVTGQDSFGADEFEWSDFLQCKARVEAASGKEFAKVMQRWAEADFVITQHFSRGVLPTMRIAWQTDDGSTYMDVLHIEDQAGMARAQTVICRTFGSTFTAQE